MKARINRQTWAPRLLFLQAFYLDNFKLIGRHSLGTPHLSRSIQRRVHPLHSFTRYFELATSVQDLSLHLAE